MEKYENMLKALFVHFDDPSKEIRGHVGTVLKAAAKVHKAEFVKLVYKGI